MVNNVGSSTRETNFLKHVNFADYCVIFVLASTDIELVEKCVQKSDKCRQFPSINPYFLFHNLF